MLALLLFAFFAAASAPSPLFVVFQQMWGFSPALLTVAFAIYALALLLSLLVAGSLSDHVGRRPVVFAALLLQAAAMGAFLLAEGIGGLIAARVIQGVATGMASGALTAAIVEAAPASQKRLGAMISSVSPLAGLAVGALLTGLAVQGLAHPVPLVFGLLSAICVMGALATLFIPESATRRPGALASLVPRISVPARARAEFVRGLPVMLAVWALGGLFLSLVPSLMQQVFGIHSGLVNGLAIATLFGMGAVSPTLLKSLPPAKAGAVGMTSMAAGLALLLASLASHSVPVFFAGTVVAGIGFGAAFSALVQTLAPLAQPNERAELFAALYAASYLAFSVPAMLAGLLIAPLGLLATVEGYAGLLILVAAVGAGLQWLALARPARP
ncbi:MAG: major facilitator superfamily 1 [Polaromonas sp.]|nr:major facilitator superfamily 1 [Polaromonas sp.]